MEKPSSPIRPAPNGLIGRTVAKTLASGISQRESLKLVKSALVVEALTRSNGNKCKAAKELQVHRNTLARDIRQLGLFDVVRDIKKAAKSAPALDAQKLRTAAG